MSTNRHVKTPLSNGALIAYGGLALPLSIAELPIILYLPAFYAKEVGLSIGMVGLVFLLARLWDGISDPIIGTLSDRSTSRFGRRKSWVVAGAPLLMAAAWFLCNPPETVGLFYLGFWAVLFYTAQTIVKIPYWSWGAELSSNYEERSKVTGFRESGSMIGNLVVASAPLLLLPNDAPVRDVLFLISALIITLIPITTVPLITKIPDRSPLVNPTFDLIRDIKSLTKNGPLIRFLTAFGLMEISIGVINSVAIFSIDIGLGLPGAFFSLFFIQYVAAILFAPLVVRLANRFDKHIILTGALVAMFVLYLIAFNLPMGNYIPVAFLIVFIGMVYSCKAILPPSILADIVDYGVSTSGEERTGVYVAALNLIMKLGLALGVGIAYGFLGLVGFDPSAPSHNAHDVLMVRTSAYGITSVLLIPAILILWKFPITKKVQRELRRKIEANTVNAKQGANNNVDAPMHKLGKATSENNLSVTTILPDNS